MAGDARTRILEAAKALAESHDSVQGVTISLESVAHQAGLTKPGLMYHFPSKQALMVGVVDHAAEHWAHMLAGQAGKPVGELSSFERHRAYVAVATTAEVSRADYWIFSDALYHPTLAEAWSGHLGPWFDTVGLDAQAVSLLTAARFCADGAWMSEATGVFRSTDLAAVREHALGLIDMAERLTAGNGRAAANRRTGAEEPAAAGECSAAEDRAVADDAGTDTGTATGTGTGTREVTA
ncbi:MULTISPECIES: TetR/AcrR family transcriptional regulator [unclassified Brevibacterium]|uniref:TetR/AcrR family transcriptional regulator n=1 Tax=unclassified Brevibacterium TaxID=2614124 RepID=UPI0010822C72|nr:TetR family transcriptional regulator [Brevibacterium sp. S111]TGD08661.1 TetR family transcriptional regulator [Brevibacterium sp. S111]